MRCYCTHEKQILNIKMSGISISGVFKANTWYAYEMIQSIDPYKVIYGGKDDVSQNLTEYAFGQYFLTEQQYRDKQLKDILDEHLKTETKATAL